MWKITYEATSIFKISCQNIKIHKYDLHEVDFLNNIRLTINYHLNILKI